MQHTVAPAAAYPLTRCLYILLRAMVYKHIVGPQFGRRSMSPVKHPESASPGGGGAVDIAGPPQGGNTHRISTL